MRQLLRTLISIAGMACVATAADAQSVADFYKGKTITLVTGTAGAGFYDLLAQVVSHYLPHYLPGNPTAVIQSMPGASMVRATEYIDNIAPRDGTRPGLRAAVCRAQ